MKPRVLITIDTYAIGGAGKVILQFLNHGGKELCSPHVVGFWRGHIDKWQFRDAIESLGVRFSAFRQRCGFDPLVVADVVRIAKENNIDILESHGYKGHIICFAVKKMTKLPWVAYVHGWTSENLKVELYNFVEKVIVRFADRIIPVSENLKSRLHLGEKASAKAVVVANAADLGDHALEHLEQSAPHHAAHKDDDVLIGIIGRLSPEKGHRYFVEAFKIVAAKRGNVKAVFVGEGQERGALAKQISRYGLGDRIVMAGYQEDVSQFYNDCDIICLPSLTEGMPNVALEAMMFALPVVASNVGGIPEVVVDGETGCLVEPQNVEALAVTLDALLGDRQKREELGRAGKRRVELEFNPVVRAQKIMGIYLGLLDGQLAQHRTLSD